MRLHPKLITYIAETVIVELLKSGMIKVDDESRLSDVVENLITEEMQVEDRLNEEVRDLLSRHYEQVRASGAEYDRLFVMVKEKLAKEKGIVL